MDVKNIIVGTYIENYSTWHDYFEWKRILTLDSLY